MKACGVLLIVLGGIGIIMSTMMLGDIGVACLIGAASALISGIGFLVANKKIEEQKK